MGKFRVVARQFWDRLLFKPRSSFKIGWDLLVIVLSVWNSIEIPYQFAFPLPDGGLTFLDVMDYTIDALFAFDIFVNFRTCYIDSKTDSLVTDPKLIYKNYIQGRFWVDLFASIPFELFTLIFQSNDSLSFQFFGMLKLVRLMRLGRMISFMKGNASLKLSIILIQRLFILLLLIHWIACLWKVVVSINSDWEPPKDLDWDSTVIYTGTPFEKYNVFFYYSILTLVTNELMPTNNLEVIMAILILLLGSVASGALIGEFTSIMNDMG